MLAASNLAVREVGSLGFPTRSLPCLQVLAQITADPARIAETYKECTEVTAPGSDHTCTCPPQPAGYYCGGAARFGFTIALVVLTAIISFVFSLLNVDVEPTDTLGVDSFTAKRVEDQVLGSTKIKLVGLQVQHVRDSGKILPNGINLLDWLRALGTTLIFLVLAMFTPPVSSCVFGPCTLPTVVFQALPLMVSFGMSAALVVLRRLNPSDSADANAAANAGSETGAGTDTATTAAAIGNKVDHPPLQLPAPSPSQGLGTLGPNTPDSTLDPSGAANAGTHVVAATAAGNAAAPLPMNSISSPSIEPPASWLDRAASMPKVLRIAGPTTPSPALWRHLDPVKGPDGRYYIEDTPAEGLERLATERLVPVKVEAVTPQSHSIDLHP